MALSFSHYNAARDRFCNSSSPAPSITRHQEELPRPMSREWVPEHDPSCITCTVRVLYTFDIRGENQCLAKLQHALPIRTVVMPDGTQIGAIQLKSCLQAVLKASPEIYSDEMDYTVYAFDPSEHGSPRVGHGKLSQIIRDGDSQEEDQAMVTGLVRSNLALLATSHQLQDSLEVRLALTPVQTREQIDNGFRSPFAQDRAQSPRMAGFPDFNGLLNKFDPQFLMMLQNAANAGTQGPLTGLDALQRFMNPPGTTNNAHSRQPSISSNFASFQPVINNSRAASPAPSTGSTASNIDRRVFKRSASNISQNNLHFIPEQQSLRSQVDGYVSSEETLPKRARVMQIERPGKTALNKKGDLRVVASSAASVRMHQPTAVRPQVHTAQSLEEPPRVPTPVPQGSSFLQRRTSGLRSTLNAETSVSQTSDARSPFSEVNLPSPNSAATSPEAMFCETVTPEGLGSSPPVIPGVDACPSSPALPPMPIHDDSGFMSGGNFPDMSEVENEAPRNSSPAPGSMQPPPKQKQSRPKPPRWISTRVLQNSPPPNVQMPVMSQKKALNAIRKGSPPPPSSDVLPDLEEPVKKPKGRPKLGDKDEKRPSWDKERRRIAMATRLANSVSNGEIPPYCFNCGVIETPTWRRAFSKLHTGEPPALVIPKGGVKEDGAIIGAEVSEQDPETGKCLLFRIYKKTLLSEDKDFEAISLCNPCGLWLKTRGLNRPEKLWNKGNDSEDTRRDDVPERQRRPRLARGDEELPSELVDTTERGSIDAANEAPALLRELSTVSELPSISGHDEGHQSPTLPAINVTRKKRKKSESTAGSQGLATRKQSSQPAHGGPDTPIEVDRGSASPVRRSLFSSPRSSGPLGVDIQSKKFPLANAVIDMDDESGFMPSVEDFGVEETALQNGIGAATETPTPCPGTPKSQALQLPPVTPMHQAAIQDSSFSRTPSNLFKTPSNLSGPSPNSHRITTSDFFSSSAKNLLHGACTDKTPSKNRKSQSPNIDDSRFSPQLPRLLRAIYGTTPPDEEFSEAFDGVGRLDVDCCPGNIDHDDNCPHKLLDDSRLTDGMDLPMLTGMDFGDADFQPSFPGTEEEWAATDAFFTSSGITGFTPRKPMAATNEQ